MRPNGILLVAALLAGSDPLSMAEETNTLELIQKLQRRIDELEHKVEALEGGTNGGSFARAANQVATPAANGAQQKPADVVQGPTEIEVRGSKLSLGTGGLVFTSADENFKFRVRGYIQGDARFYVDDANHQFTDTFLLNRVRPVFEGTVFKNFDYKMMPDFGQGRTVIQDAYLDAHFLPWLSLRVGKYKAPVGIERLQSARDLIFVERALTVDLVPNRDIGAALHGEFFNGVLGYEAGVFNGVTDGGSGDTDENDSKDFAGRLFAYPFKRSRLEGLQGLGVGVAGTAGHENGQAPAYKTIGQQTFFQFNSGVTANGTRDRIAPQAYYYWGPFGLLGEYVISSQDVNAGAFHERLANSAWQVAASYVLTGEKASYTGVSTERPFNPAQGQWGALEFAARVSQLDVDADAFRNYGTPQAPRFLADATRSASRATAFGVGLNWYLNTGVKFMLDYERTSFEGGASHGGDRPAENTVFSRMQVAF